MNAEIRFYLSIFLRRFHYFALVAIMFTSAGVAVAVMLPTKYRAEALLLVESPQIPDELAASTVRTNPSEQLEIMEQRLLTRPNLLDIADQLEVFPNRSRMFPDQVVDTMRQSTTFRVSTGQNRASLFRIGFTAERPEVTAAVVNAYVDRVLADTVELRTGRAEDTQEFFQQEVERLAQDLAAKSAAILDFKNRNIDALPENLDYQLDRLDELRDRIVEIDREIQSLGRQRERLILVFNATGGQGQGAVDLRTPEQRELAELQSELATALTVYSEQNPRVKILRGRIASLEERVASQGDPEDNGTPITATTILDLQLKELDDRVDELQAQRRLLEPAMERLEASIEATPSNSITLETLQRDYQNIQDQYNQAVARAAAASTGERIELLSKGERITVISQPVVPREPYSPNRPRIAIMGAGTGIAAGLGLIMLLELLNRSIRRPADLTRSLGIVPLATLPMIRTPREILWRRTIVLSAIVFGTAGVVGSIYYVHMFVRPIDLIIARAVGMLGL